MVVDKTVLRREECPGSAMEGLLDAHIHFLLAVDFSCSSHLSLAFSAMLLVIIQVSTRMTIPSRRPGRTTSCNCTRHSRYSISLILSPRASA